MGADPAARLGDRQPEVRCRTPASRRRAGTPPRSRAAFLPARSSAARHRRRQHDARRRAAGAPRVPTDQGHVTAGAARDRAASRRPVRRSRATSLAARASRSAAAPSCAIDAEPRADVVVLDSIGELAQLYQIATVAFVGGSLVPTRRPQHPRACSLRASDRVRPVDVTTSRRSPTCFSPMAPRCRWRTNPSSNRSSRSGRRPGAARQPRRGGARAGRRQSRRDGAHAGGDRPAAAATGRRAALPPGTLTRERRLSRCTPLPPAVDGRGSPVTRRGSGGSSARSSASAACRPAAAARRRSSASSRAVLLEAGHRPAILSRGYGRTAPDDGVTIVSDGTRLRADLARAGDEPLMLARALAGRAGGRVAGSLSGRTARRAALGATVHVLDDGFQHLVLARDVDLLIVDAADADRPRLLPSGRLREPLARPRYADAILVSRRRRRRRSDWPSGWASQTRSP